MPTAGDYEPNHNDPGETEPNPSDVAPVPDTAGRDEDTGLPDFKKYGWIPFWRAWQSAWWWDAKPWSQAHLFIHLVLSANRVSRTARYLHRVIPIDRGCLATSYEALAERAGLSRKVVTRMIRDLADAGEVEVLSKGQCGILLRISKYNAYTFPPVERDSERHSKGTVAGRQQDKHGPLVVQGENRKGPHSNT